MRMRKFALLLLPAVSAGWCAQRLLSRPSGTAKLFVGNPPAVGDDQPVAAATESSDHRAAKDAMREARSKVEERMEQIEAPPRKTRRRKTIPPAGP